MSFSEPPRIAAWQHRDARDGFEVVALQTLDDGIRIEGSSTAVEGGEPWAIRYVITLDAYWVTQTARIAGFTADGTYQRSIDADGAGGWLVDGTPAPELYGCFDIDLEASAFTNALPIHRLGLAVGERAGAPAAYVRALDARVERLEQAYERVVDRGGSQRYDYAAPVFDFEARLTYDRSGLVLDYPGIAVRAA